MWHRLAAAAASGGASSAGYGQLAASYWLLLGESVLLATRFVDFERIRRALAITSPNVVKFFQLSSREAKLIRRGDPCKE